MTGSNQRKLAEAGRQFTQVHAHRNKCWPCQRHLLSCWRMKNKRYAYLSVHGKKKYVTYIIRATLVVTSIQFTIEFSFPLDWILTTSKACMHHYHLAEEQWQVKRVPTPSRCSNVHRGRWLAEAGRQFTQVHAHRNKCWPCQRHLLSCWRMKNKRYAYLSVHGKKKYVTYIIRATLVVTSIQFTIEFSFPLDWILTTSKACMHHYHLAEEQWQVKRVPTPSWPCS